MPFYTISCQIGAELVRQFRERVPTQKTPKRRMIKANAPKAHIISYGYTKAEYEEAGMRNGDTEKERNILPLFLCLKISCMNDVE